MNPKFFHRLAVGAGLAFLSQSVAQTLEVTSTGVGIGTNSPAYSLHSTGSIGVGGDQQFIARYNSSESYKATLGWSHLQLGNNGPNWIVAGRTQAGGAMSFVVNNTADYSYGGFNGVVAMHLAASGSVGIGTSSPTAKLEINGGALAVKPTTSSHGFVALDPGGSGYGGYVEWYKSGPVRLGYMGYLDLAGGQSNLGLNLENSANFIIGGGNVGIGTATPSYKLEVSGSVRATSFIANSNTYADFVFKPGYKLASLSEVEAAIKTHGHLPDIPSEAEAKARGIDLAAMQVKLLQKVEEMTLYLVAHEKKLQTQQEELQRLQVRNEALERQVAEYKKR